MKDYTKMSKKQLIFNAKERVIHVSYLRYYYLGSHTYYTMIDLQDNLKRFSVL